MEIQFAHSAAPVAESFTESEGLLPVSRESKDEFEVERVVAGVSKEDMSSLIRCLYWSHFLSRWGDRMWEFAVGLLMLQVWPDSLLLVAIYGFVETASVATLGVLVGELVDTLPRLKVPCKCRHTLDLLTFKFDTPVGSLALLVGVSGILQTIAFSRIDVQERGLEFEIAHADLTVQLSLSIQNGSVVAASVGVILLLLHPGTAPGGYGTFVMLVIIVNAFGATNALSGMAMDIVVERDWVVLIAEKQGSGFLTQINAAMRRIDLSCKLLAPIGVGFMMSSVSVLASAILIAVWNVTSVGVEYWLLHYVYMAMPVLQKKSTAKAVSRNKSQAASEQELSILESGHAAEVEENEEVRLLEGRSKQTRSRQSTFVEKLKHLPLVEGWATYMHQEAMLAGLALALLYFTVLSFGSFMTAVLNWRGIPPYVLGLARGVGAVCGIIATVIYPIVHARLHTIRTGIWSIWIQCSLLSMCVVSIWIHNSRVASILLISGVAASRLGLWMFDLSVTQLMQESVPEAERGVVGGVQKSLQSLMDMLTYVVGMVIVRPQDFGITICMSYAAVVTAALLYSLHAYRVRGHLFHFDHLRRSK